MKNIRKALGVLLSVLVILSSVAVIAFAAECNHLYTATNVAPTCVEDGYTLYVCQYCSDYYRDYKNGISALGHTYGAWKTLQEESCQDEGYYQRDCSRCGASEVKTVSVIAHLDKNSDGECDFCSIDMNPNNNVSPFDWLIAFFNFIAQWFRDLFA